MDTIDPTASQDGVAAVSYKDPAAPALFTDSLHRTGFGVVRDHPIPQALVEEIYAEWLDFFNGDAKHAYAFDKQSMTVSFPRRFRKRQRATPSATSRNFSTSSPGGAIRPRYRMRRDAITRWPANSPASCSPGSRRTRRRR